MCTNESTKNNFLKCDCHYCLSLRKRSEKVFNKTKFKKGEYVLYDGKIYKIQNVKKSNLKSLYSLNGEQYIFCDEDLKSTYYNFFELNKTKVLYKDISHDYWIVTDKKIEDNNVILTIMSSVDNNISIEVNETDVKILSYVEVECLEKFFKNNYNCFDDLFTFKQNFTYSVLKPICAFCIIDMPTWTFPYVHLREVRTNSHFYVNLFVFVETYEILEKNEFIIYNKYLRKLDYFNWIYNIFYKIF